ncbi:MAG: hypothetical protein DRJ52_09260 [Thermoprotei archaeon]|nr:MAG: hypothetical protein DRJ52_09260 [Thermoprotei archaeon]
MKTVYYYGLKHYEALLVSFIFFGNKVKLVEDFEKALTGEHGIVSCILNGVKLVIIRREDSYRIVKWSDLLKALSGTIYQKSAVRNHY